MNVPAYIKGYTDHIKKPLPFAAPSEPSTPRLQPSSYKPPIFNKPKPSAHDGMLINPR